MVPPGPCRALIGSERGRGRFERRRPARRRRRLRHDAAPVAAEDGAEPPHAGGAEERRDVQRAPGELRQLDEHQPARGHLHLPGRRQILEDAGVLHPGQHHQIPPHPRRDHRHGEGGGGVQGPRPRRDAAAEAAEGPRGGRRRARCLWWPWPRDTRQWKRPAGKKAGQAGSEAVRGCLRPGQGQCRDALWFDHTSGLPRVEKCSVSAPPPGETCPNRVVWKPLVI